MSPRKRARRPALHRESLLRIPLVRAAFEHPDLRPRARAVDLRWFYDGVVVRRLSGFQPLSGSVYYGRYSRVAEWLSSPEASARRLNDGDHLAREVLFCVHDFLHAWALAAVRSTLPVLDPSRTQDLEALAFVHLATEAAATAGLDYWYLCTREPEEICDIGTRRFPLTTHFHERYAREYRRFCPDLAVQSPAFFVDLVDFYCTGRWEGFSTDDLSQSPRLAHWLTHEVRYGEDQRTYIRAWLAFMSGMPVQGSDPGRPVRCNAPWQRAMIHALAVALWRLVQSGEGAAVRMRSSLVRWPRIARPFDPRFVSVRRMSPDALLAAMRDMYDPSLLAYACEQLVCAHDFAAFDHRLRPALRAALVANDLPALAALLRGVPRVPASEDEPELLFLLN